MSSKTRREKRKAAAALPVQTDWLWSCLPGMPLGEIARWLDFSNEPRTELSVRTWTDERRLKEDLCRAFVPDIPLDQLVPRMVWDAFDEHLVNACADGRLIVLRDLPIEVPYPVQMLVDNIGFRRRERGWHFFESRPGARFALVLDGWTETTIRVRSQYTTRYTVQALNNVGDPRPARLTWPCASSDSNVPGHAARWRLPGTFPAGQSTGTRFNHPRDAQASPAACLPLIKRRALFADGS